MKRKAGLVALLTLSSLTGAPWLTHAACTNGASSVDLTVNIGGEIRTGTNSVSLNDANGTAHAYPGGITIAPRDFQGRGDAVVKAGDDCALDKLSLENARITVTAGATVPIVNYPIEFWGSFTSPFDSNSTPPQVNVLYDLGGSGEIFRTNSLNKGGQNDEIKALAWILNPIATGQWKPLDNSHYLYKRIPCFTLAPATCNDYFGATKSYEWPDPPDLTGDRNLKIQLLLVRILDSTDTIDVNGCPPGVDCGIYLKARALAGGRNSGNCSPDRHGKKPKNC